jgi:putative FmdB family regulatory protein
MPIYEYRCEECAKRSTSLLPSYSSPDPPCPHCGKSALKRLVSTFATTSSGDTDGGDDFDGGDGGQDDFGDDFGGMGDDFGAGGDFGDDDS